MAGHIEGVSREQVMLLPDRLDDYVGPAALVRVIDRFVERVDAAGLGFRLAVPAGTGRPGYAPQVLLKLYVYGYVNGVRSSRQLERSCLRNVEVMWLAQKLVPDHKTIATFRQESGEAIKAVCAGFVQFCRSEGLLGRAEVAVDGSKLRAAAGRRRVATRKEVAKDLEKLREQIGEYLKELDQTDEAEGGELEREEEAARVRAALEKLKKKQASLEQLDEAIVRSGQKTLVTSEPEARAMSFPGGSKGPGYNLQIAVSTDTHLIVHHEVVQDRNDVNQLYPMALGAQQALGLPGGGEAAKLQVLADSGYSNGEHAAQCEAAGIVPVVPPRRAVNTHGGYFDRSHFTYDAETDSYTCPAGERLSFKQQVPQDRLNKYIARDCRQCRLKAQCTKSNRRSVTRHWYEAELERMAQRTADPEPMRRRRCAAEHPFGSFKGIYGARFLTKGLKNTRTEAALEVLAYNIKRAIALIGVPRMLAALA
jgi:transposase